MSSAPSLIPPENRLSALAADARLFAAYAQRRLGRLDDAERIYRAMLETPQMRRQKSRALEGLARVLVRGRRYDEAAAMWERVVEADPNSVGAALQLARCYQRAGRVADAVRSLERFTQMVPGAVEPKYQLALLRHKHRLSDREAAIRDVLALAPQHRDALGLLARTLARNRVTTDQALELWLQVYDLKPHLLWPLLERAKLFLRDDRVAEAEAQYRHILTQIAPRDKATHVALGRMYLARGRVPEALQTFDALLRFRGRDIDARLWRAQCLDRLDRIAEAEATYADALKIDPKSTAAYSYRARMLHAVGRTEEAVEDWRKVCALEPQQSAAWRALIYLLASAERETEALAALDSAERALGTSPAAAIDLGFAAQAAMFNDRAVAFFARAVAAEPNNAEHLASFGEFYYRAGEIDGAFHTLLDSRECDPYQLDVAKSLIEIIHALNAIGIDHIALRRAPRTAGKIFFPERLFARVRELADTQVTPYEPVPGRIAVMSSSLAPGGAERQLVNMLRGLSGPAYQLDLSLFCISLASRSKRDFFRPLLDGTGVEIVVPDPASAEKYFRDPAVAPYADLIRRFPEDMTVPIAFWLKEFRERRPQIVHAWQDATNLSAAVAALLAGVPRIVLCTRSVRPDNPRRRLKRFMKEAYEAVLSHPSVMLTNNSQAGAEDYADWLGLAADRVAVVHNGIDFEKLEHGVDRDVARRERKALGIPDDAPIVGSVFRMSEEKRPLLWLDVAAEVARARPETHFVICGDGPMRDEMIEYAKTLGIADRVHLPGSHTNIGTWYSMMDVVMLTSRHEGLPNVLLEAQGLGIPVVAPDVGGMGETVWQGVTGWIVRDADARDLAERVLFCLGDEAWRREARAKAPGFVHEGFSMAAMVRRNLEVYGLAPGVSGAMTIDELADILKRREVARVSYFHTDHFEPWSDGIDDKAARAVERFGKLARGSRYGNRLSLFYSTFLPYRLYNEEDGAPLDARVDGDTVVFHERSERQEELARDTIRPLVTSDSHEMHLHVHHEFWTRNDSNFDGPISRWVNEHSTAEADEKRLELFFDLNKQVIERETGRPFERWGFVHGNWALAASDPLICQVETELGMIMRHGGWGDFSFPAGRSYCDPKMEMPFTCRPIDGKRVYDLAEAEARPVGRGADALQPDRFFIWNSAIKSTWSSLDYYTEANRKHLMATERIARRWLEQSVTLGGTLFLKTHAHSMKWEYRLAEPDAMIPHCYPDTVAVFDLFTRTCERAHVPIAPVTVNEMMAELKRSDEGPQQSADKPRRAARWWRPKAASRVMTE